MNCRAVEEEGLACLTGYNAIVEFMRAAFHSVPVWPHLAPSSLSTTHANKADANTGYLIH